jgi:cyclin C
MTDYIYSEKDVIECEFYALDVLEYDLILFHPHRPLLLYLNDFGLTDLTEMAW